MRAPRALAAVAVPLALLLTTAASTLAASPAGGAERSYLDPVDITFPTHAEASYTDSYDAGRSGGAHRATDLIGQKHWGVYAAAAGTITWIPGADGSAMPSYGYMITVAGDDGRTYHYVHLNNDTPGTDDGQGGPEHAYAAGLAKGSRVQRGQLIGYLGDSGNAESTAPHLHFEIRDPDVTDPYGTDYLNPIASLDAARARGDYPLYSASSSPARDTDDACPPGQEPATRFPDVPRGSTHAAAVDCAVWWEIASGLADGTYGPDLDVTRAQMATFVVRLLGASGELPPAAENDHFPDDDASHHHDAINRLAAARIVGGAADGLFHPDEVVSRAQMASFLVRAFEWRARASLPPADDAFTDDDGDVHEPAIDKAAAAGFTAGTADGRFRPALTVSRAQMASFLTRALDKLIDDGYTPPPSTGSS